MSDWLRFDEYMHDCLYGPEIGFYRQGQANTGSRGDFITSPSVGPLFGQLLARWVAKEHGDTVVNIYDVGSNSGILAGTLAGTDEALEHGWKIITVDYSGADLTPEEFALEPLDNSVVIANELLDNLRFRILVLEDGSWHEVYVDAKSETSSEALLPADLSAMPSEIVNAISSIEASSASEVRVPVLTEANYWVADVIRRTPLSLMCLDYGARTTGTLVDRGAWLRTYSSHSVGSNPYLEPGSTDITCDVAFDQLPAPGLLMTQQELLRDLGIEAMVQEGDDYWATNSSSPDLRALEMKSRSTQAEHLLSAEGLGSWLVGVWQPQ